MFVFFRKWKHLFYFVEIEMLPGSSNCSDKLPYPQIRNENGYRVSTVLNIQTHTVHKPDELMVWIHVDQSECTLLATRPEDAILSRIPAASTGCIWWKTVLLPTPRSCAILGNFMLMRLCRHSSDIISLCCPLAVSTTSTRADGGRLSPSCKYIRLKRLDTALRLCCCTSKILSNVPIHD